MTFYDKTATSFADYILKNLAAKGVKTTGLVTKDDFSSWYRTFMTEQLPTQIRLSGVAPDFEQIFTALQVEVTKNASWNDVSVSATGSMLLAAVAEGIAYAQASIIRAAQETALDTARLPNSVYAIVRMLGVRIQRKTPSLVNVTLTNSDTTVEQIIQPYSRWSVGRDVYFNRSIVVFKQGETTLEDVELYEGDIIEERFVSNGEPYQRFEIGLPDFTLSNEDIQCFVGGVEWEKSDGGVWSYGAENIFQEDTTARGTAEITFGSGEYGNIPTNGAEILFRYARTRGETGAYAVANADVTCQSNSNVSGFTASGSQGGGDEKDFEFYKVNGPSLHSSINKAVTREQYKALIATYPGIVDAEALGQQHVDPSDPKLFNRVKVTALKYDGVNFTDDEWETFKLWLEDRSLIGVHLERADPSAVIVDIKADVYCLQKANLKSVRQSLETHLRDVFKIRTGLLGRSLYRDDVHRALKNEDATRNLITHVVLKSPATDVKIDEHSFIKLRNITLNVNYSERDTIDGS